MRGRASNFAQAFVLDVFVGPVAEDWTVFSASIERAPINNHSCDALLKFRRDTCRSVGHRR